VRLKQHVQEKEKDEAESTHPREKRIFMHSNLPHISQESHYQFITFRTKDSTDDFVKSLLANYNIKSKETQYKIDKYLDSSLKGAYLNDEIIDLAKDYILKIEKNLCEVISFIIMPNHIHILLIQKTDLTKIIQYLKGGLAYIINKKLNKKGSLWQKTYFDKIIRDEKHFGITYEYIKNNAIKAGLKDSKKRFYSIYE
jgi:REP element-mobilizing transposase RayT